LTFITPKRESFLKDLGTRQNMYIQSKQIEKAQLLLFSINYLPINANYRESGTQKQSPLKEYLKSQRQKPRGSHREKFAKIMV